MPEFHTDCPRCGASHTTFDYVAQSARRHRAGMKTFVFETYNVCRACDRGTIFIMQNINSMLRGNNVDFPELNLALGKTMQVTKHISVRNQKAKKAPDDVPKKIANIYLEATESLTGNCYNAACAMFRTALDMTTQNMVSNNTAIDIPKDDNYTLNKRIKWLISNNFIPSELQDFLDNVRLDGNDAAHEGTATEAESLDLQDFVDTIFDRIYVQPAKLERAKQRRAERRKPKNKLPDSDK